MSNMKEMMKVLIFSLLALLVVACGNTDVSSEGSDNPSINTDKSLNEEIRIAIANITNEKNSWSKSAEQIGEELKEKSDGRITVELYPGGQLGNEEDMMQQLNSGSIQMAFITMAHLSNLSPSFNGWMLPFLVEDHDQAHELITSQEALDLFDTLTTENIKGLGYVSGGFRTPVTTTPIESAKDFKNLKLRTVAAPIILDFWNSLEASPTQMPLTEVYSALQTGVIEGLSTDIEALVTENLMEGTKYMIPIKTIYTVGGIIVNKDFWDGLSEENRELIEVAVNNAVEFDMELIKEREAELEDIAEDQYGLEVLQFDSKKEFAHFTNDFREEWIQKSQSPELEAFVKKAEEIVGEGGK